MSGGVAYVLNEHGDFERNCNLQMVALEKLEDPEEVALVREMIEKHHRYTQSQKASAVLENWEEYLPKFVKVMPRDYKRVLEAFKRVTASGLSGEDAIMAAFEENSKDASRVGGG
jgi:glutamate synthase (ferredoxin)